MIKVKLLNSGASLNDYKDLGSLDFIPGENVKVVVQIWDSQKNIRYIPGVDAELKLSFTKKDSTQLDKDAEILNADDRSMWFVELSQAESVDIAGQNIIVTLDELGDGTIIHKSLMANVMVRTNLSGDC